MTSALFRDPGREAARRRSSRLLRRRRARDRRRREGPRGRATGPSTSARRSSTTATSSTSCARRAPVFVEEVDEVPDGAWLIFSAHGIAPGRARRRRATATSNDRRDLPARDEGPPRGDPLARRATRSSSSATTTTTRPSARSARRPSAIRLVETREDAEKVTGRRPGEGRLPDADDALARRHARHRGGPQAPVPEPEGAAEGRHLLRDAEPPGRGQGDGARTWTCCSSSARPTAPTRCACARSPAPTASASHLIERADGHPGRVARRREACSA